MIYTLWDGNVICDPPEFVNEDTRLILLSDSKSAELTFVRMNNGAFNKHYNHVGHLESKERSRIQPAQLFNFS